MGARSPQPPPPQLPSPLPLLPLQERCLIAVSHFCLHRSESRQTAHLEESTTISVPRHAEVSVHLNKEGLCTRVELGAWRKILSKAAWHSASANARVKQILLSSNLDQLPWNTNRHHQNTAHQRMQNELHLNQRLQHKGGKREGYNPGQTSV